LNEEKLYIDEIRKYILGENGVILLVYVKNNNKVALSISTFN
jgi:hypothetical protein